MSKMLEDNLAEPDTLVIAELVKTKVERVNNHGFTSRTSSKGLVEVYCVN